MVAITRLEVELRCSQPHRKPCAEESQDELTRVTGVAGHILRHGPPAGRSLVMIRISTREASFKKRAR